MTKAERREVYWEMYTVAQGLSQMSPYTIKTYNEKHCGGQLPNGFCYLLRSSLSYNLYLDQLHELQGLKPTRSSSCYWFYAADWKPRAKLLLKAIELTY